MSILKLALAVFRGCQVGERRDERWSQTEINRMKAGEIPRLSTGM